MADQCSCPPCSNHVVTRMKNKLNRVQVAMLGYFCVRCILKQCGAEHNA